jgi:hypothetical protein
MQLQTFSLKTLPGLYCAWSPDLGLVSYGACQDEAINNLQEEARSRHKAGEGERHAG